VELREWCDALGRRSSDSGALCPRIDGTGCVTASYATVPHRRQAESSARPHAQQAYRVSGLLTQFVGRPNAVDVGPVAVDRVERRRRDGRRGHAVRVGTGLPNRLRGALLESGVAGSPPTSAARQPRTAPGTGRSVAAVGKDRASILATEPPRRTSGMGPWRRPA